MKKYIALVSSAIIIVLDQLFKYLALKFLSEDVLTFPIIEDIFHLTYLENRGAAFGILNGRQVFLIIVTSLAIAACVYFIFKINNKNMLLSSSLALIVGGGIGNLIDRIFRGFVIDYLDFRVINFAVFNFADCCVVIGTILLFLALLFFTNEDYTFKNRKKVSDGRKV